jgi:hypothetical protein
MPVITVTPIRQRVSTLRLLGETEQPEARVGYNGYDDLMRRSKGVERISFSEG